MRVHLLHNAGAGGGNLPPERLVAILRAAGHAVEAGDHHAPDAAAAAAAEAVIVAGGDGTVGRALLALGAGGPPIAILPLGGSNNVARALGAEAGPEALAAGLAGAPERALDLGRAEGPWGETGFIEGVGVGPVAGIIAAAGSRKISPSAKRDFAQRALTDLVRDAAPRDWRLRLDGVALSGPHLLVEVLNVGFAAAGLPLAPEACPGDGTLDAVALEPSDRDAFLAWLAGGAEGPPPLRRARVRRAELDWADAPLRIDDSLPDPPLAPARVALSLVGAARILVPPATPPTAPSGAGA